MPILPSNIEYVTSSVKFTARNDDHEISANIIDGNKLRFISYSSIINKFKASLVNLTPTGGLRLDLAYHNGTGIYLWLKDRFTKIETLMKLLKNKLNAKTVVVTRGSKGAIVLNNKKLICVSPDVGGVARTRALATRIKADLAIIDKRRPSPGKSEVMNIIGNVKNKTCIIVDDIIDSGGTIVNAVDALKKNGANEVYVFITHAVLSGDAVKKIKNSKIKKLIITDTIDNIQKIKNNNKIEVLSIASLMSEAIKRIANSNSVSDLFN